MTRSLLLIALIGIFSQLLPAQDDGVRAEVEKRKAYVMTYMDEVITMDDKQRKMAAAIVDVYIQSIVQTAMQTPLNDRSKAIYNEINKNHLMLLGNYLSEEQMQTYKDALMEGAADRTVCIYCDHPRKTDRSHCMFCGTPFLE